jgi:diguanylate cyclase (GGDEF)-like protein
LLKKGIEVAESGLMRRVLQQPAGQHPELAPSEPAAMVRSLGWLYVAGGTIGWMSLLLPRAPGSNAGALEVNIGVAYLGGAVLLLTSRRMPLWMLHLMLLAGALLITRAVYFSGAGNSYYGVWYLWIALFAFSFFRRRQAAFHVAIAGAAYAAVLAVRHEPVAEARWLTTISALLIAGVFIDALVRRIRRQGQHAADSAENMSTVVDAMNRIFQRPTADATRLDLCKTASAVSHADGAVLWELNAGGRTLTASAATGAGAGVAVPWLSLEDPSTGAAKAYTTGQVGFARLGDENSRELEPSEDGPALCALWQPVLRDNVTVGVLALYWMTAVASPVDHMRASIALLAAQTAVAIERVELLARLEGIAHTDELTGLPNRRAWREGLSREMARAKRERSPLCVAMLDVDGLKKLNDTHGHHAGDQLLKQNAAAWASAARPDDLLARYGGDEFALILTGCRLEDGRELIERLVEATPADHSFSAGVAEWDGMQDADALMAEADARLYAAKAQRHARSSPPGTMRRGYPNGRAALARHR